MQLTHLSLTHFRNFTRLDIDVPGGSVLLVGQNAQGKTSLLEAIYYLATFTSFHASQDRQLISFHTNRDKLAVARIVADFKLQAKDTRIAAQIEAVYKLEVRLIAERDDLGNERFRKEILLNGAARKAGDAVGAFNAVLFLPQMLRIIEGSPEERRRYLNLSLGQVLPGYAKDLTDYQKSLVQRNALLKQLNERGGDVQQLYFWDEQVARKGARIIFARIQAVSELERIAARIHQELSHGHEILRLDYRPSFETLETEPLQYTLPLKAPLDRTGQTVEQIQDCFLDQLKRFQREDIQRGVTKIGPHRDELRFLGNAVDLGIFGSRGQARTAVLAMKLAEVAWMEQKTGQQPVLLLDEVLAELDPLRRTDLLERVSTSEQALLTTTDLDLFTEEFLNEAKLWEISAGQVSVQR